MLQWESIRPQISTTARGLRKVALVFEASMLGPNAEISVLVMRREDSDVAPGGKTDLKISMLSVLICSRRCGKLEFWGGEGGESKLMTSGLGLTLSRGSSSRSFGTYANTAN